MKKTFANTDYRLIFSEHGEDAHQQILLFKPDLVIAGTALGKRSGLQLCKDIKSHEDCKRIPCVLLKELFDGAAGQDPEDVQADGVITKPLQGSELLRLVDKLTAEGTMKKKKDLLLSELEKLDDGEIIELVDVVEEPESKVSINDLMAPEKEDLLGDIAPLETWEKPFKKESGPHETMEKPLRKGEGLLEGLEHSFTEEQQALEDELTLSFDDTVGEKAAETDLQLGKDGLADDLFEKIDLDDILQKVEEIKPSFAQEAEGPKGTRASQETPAMKEEPPERFFNLEEFETALLKGVKTGPEEDPSSFLARGRPGTEAPPEFAPLAAPMTEGAPEPAGRAEGFRSFFAEEPRTEAPREIPPFETPRMDKPAAHAAAQAAAEAAAPARQPEDLQPFFKEESLEEIPTALASSEALVETEELRELPEEEFPEALLEEELKEEDVSIIEMPKEEKMGVIEEVQTPRVVPQEESGPTVRRPDKQVEELITKGIQMMMEDFVKKVVPEIAQNIVSLTMERIEQMVKEIVPDLAQKAIQDEIRRLQTGEKD